MKKTLILTILAAGATVLQAQKTDVLIEKPGPPSRPGAPSMRGQGGVVAQTSRRELREPGGRFGGGHGQVYNMLHPGGAPAKALVILNSDKEGKKTKEITEDLAVMARILEDSFPDEIQRDPMRKVLGITLSMQEGENARNFYLEDYGVVFFQAVGLPLLPAEKVETKNVKEGEPENSTWEETKQELYGRKRSSPGNRVRMAGVRSLGFDARKVEELQEALISSLRNANNIRHLRPDDSITIVVTGPIGSGTTEGVAEELEVHTTEDVFIWNSGENEPERATMVLRAKKADVDEFARKKLDLGGFKEKLNVSIY